MYLDGYVAEGLVERVERSTDPSVVAEKAHRDGNTTVVDRKHRTVFSMQPGEAAVFGLRERSL